MNSQEAVRFRNFDGRSWYEIALEQRARTRQYRLASLVLLILLILSQVVIWGYGAEMAAAASAMHSANVQLESDRAEFAKIEASGCLGSSQGR